MNIIVYLCILFVSILTTHYARKLLGKLGLIITFIGMSTISLILSFKYITIHTINSNANCISYITMFTSLYILSGTTEKKEIKQIINLNFIINTFTSIMIYIMTYYTQSLTDTISINMSNVFMNNSQILLVYPITTLLSNYLLIIVYKKIRVLYDNPFITTVTTYLLVGIIEGIIYTFLVYGKILSVKNIILILLSTYMIRLITTVVHSLYLTSLNKKEVKLWIVHIY